MTDSQNPWYHQQQSALEELNFDVYTDKELSQLQSELSKKVDFLDLENAMFESYINRVIHGKDSDEKGNNNAHAGNNEQNGGKFNDEGGADRGGAGNQGNQKDGRREKKKKNEKAKDIDKPILLTSEQKSEIATRELEELKDDILTEKEEWGKVMDNYKVNSGLYFNIYFDCPLIIDLCINWFK